MDKIANIFTLLCYTARLYIKHTSICRIFLLFTISPMLSSRHSLSKQMKHCLCHPTSPGGVVYSLSLVERETSTFILSSSSLPFRHFQHPNGRNSTSVTQPSPRRGITVSAPWRRRNINICHTSILPSLPSTRFHQYIEQQQLYLCYSTFPQYGITVCDQWRKR